MVGTYWALAEPFMHCQTDVVRGDCPGKNLGHR